MGVARRSVPSWGSISVKKETMQDAIGFDNDKYLQEQSTAILERVARFGNKLYLEFGGKLLFDYHAARVLPGFDPNVKMRLWYLLASLTASRMTFSFVSPIVGRPSVRNKTIGNFFLVGF